jgi:hypothetical protein
MRSWIKGMLKQIEKRVENLKTAQNNLNRTIEEIEKMDSLNKEKIIQMVKESIKKREENKNYD